jgi:DNA polymerase-3 subunit delta'
VEREKIDLKSATKIAHQAQGNYNLALHLLHDDSDEYPFEEWFVTSTCSFKAKGMLQQYKI